MKVSDKELNMIINLYKRGRNAEKRAIYWAAIELKELRDKNKPVKPVTDRWGVYPTCPECGTSVDIEGGKCDYCPDCGQAIDWGKESI